MYVEFAWNLLSNKRVWERYNWAVVMFEQMHVGWEGDDEWPKLKSDDKKPPWVWANVNAKYN